VSVAVAEPVFARDGDIYVPTAHAVGPWDPQALHGGAPTALAAGAIEALAPAMRVARLTAEFLGPVPLAPLRVEAAIVRPGRRFQVAEATVRARDRDALRVRAVLMRRGAVAGVPRGDAPAPLAPGPEAVPRLPLTDAPSFAGTGMDVRVVAGAFTDPGPAAAWFRLDRPLVAGEAPTPVQRAVAAADFGNGLSQVLDWTTWLYVNTDLTVHLHRDPEGEWVALDARTVIEPDGSGLATSILHDRRGPIGTAAQTLFVDRR
jgi:hypothetical protein